MKSVTKEHETIVWHLEFLERQFLALEPSLPDAFKVNISGYIENVRDFLKAKNYRQALGDLIRANRLLERYQVVKYIRMGR